MMTAAAGAEGSAAVAAATRRGAVWGQGAGLALLSGAVLGGGGSGRVLEAAAAAEAGAPDVTDRVRAGWWAQIEID